jgi:signal transduction histidine kinase
VTAGLSLRWRLIIGSLLWTAGLVLVVNYVSIAAITRVHGPQFHAATMCIFGMGCMGVALWQVHRGLGALRDLRARLATVRGGSEARIAGTYPAEVQPLVDELNALLDHRDRAIARAQARAGDLAHGLKTPLAVLAHAADRGDVEELREALVREIDRMRRQIDYHLAHARAAASGATAGVACGVEASAQGLARTLDRLYADRGVAIAVDVDQRLTVRARREDLDEMLGNLLDNACKWARTRVSVGAVREGASIVVVVDDDGPGIDEAMREAVLQRGVRADQAAPGSGLGLAIVRDLAGLLEGSIALDRSPLGGVRARLTLPSA